MDNNKLATKAQTINFIYAGKEVTCLLLPDGTKAIALSQISHQFLESRKLSTKQLKSLSGKDFQSHQKVV